MRHWQKYAPILHTGFGNTYTKEDMEAFIKWIDERGYSGFSAEGKAKAPTDDIDGWVEGYMRGLEFASEAAEKKELEVWLFDEWGYPTGTAAGKTMENHPEWRSKTLHLEIDITLSEGQTVTLDAPENFLAAAAWHIGRDTFGRPLSEDTPVYPKDGKLVYTATHRRERLCVAGWQYDNFRTVGVFVADPEDDKQGTLDLLCKEAVAYFISCMHERYIPYLGKYFGKAVKGFFYDEPFLSYPYPYTFDILSEFADIKGYDLTPHLPRMLAGLSMRDGLAYRDICTSRAAEAFYGQMRTWCEAHGLAMTGHQDLDHTVRTLDSVSGHFFKNSAQSDAPGVDYIWAQLQPGFFADYPRFAGSARRLLGKEHAVSESFAATGKCLHPDFMRFCLDYQIVRGIDRFYLMIADPVPEDHLFDTPLSKDHPQSEAFGLALNRRTALLNMLVNVAKPGAHIGLYIDMEAMQSGLQGLKRPSAVSVSPYRPVWEYVDEAARALCHMPVDYDYVWREALLDLSLQDGALVTSTGQRIDTLILPATPIVEDGVTEKLRSFIGQGGRLICLNNPPDALIGEVEVCPDISCLRDFIQPELTIDVLSGRGMVSATKRIDDQYSYYFLLNEDDRPCSIKISNCDANAARYDFKRECWLDASLDCLAFAPMELIALRIGGEGAEKPYAPCGKAQNIGGWKAITPEGKAIDLSKKLIEWNTFYNGTHSGWMRYETSFTVDQSGDYRLDLGHVCYAAKVFIDDQEYTAAFAPYNLDLSLSTGKHSLRVDVLNTDTNRYTGSPDAEKASLDEGNRGWLRTKMGNDRKYITSGLLGPVTVTPIRAEA